MSISSTIAALLSNVYLWRKTLFFITRRWHQSSSG